MTERTMAKLIMGGVGLFIAILVITAITPITIIGAGERGVVFNNTSGVEETILGEGMHFRIPLVQSIKTVDVRVQRDEAKSISGTNDLQTATIDTVVNWRVNPDKVNIIYQEIGNTDAVLDSILRPRVSEVVKASAAKFNASELLTKRTELKAEIDSRLREDLARYNIILEDISISNIDFDDQFDEAVEAKVRAEQEAQKAENDLKRVEFEAQQRVTTAKAEAESIRIQTEALSQNSNLIELTKAEALKISAEKGQKIVPDTVLGTGGSYLVNLK